MGRAEGAGGTTCALAFDRAERFVGALWSRPPPPPHLVHGDLTPDNVIVDDDETLIPIDFQDLVRGLDVQDLVIALSSFGRFEDAGRLREEFQAGYRTVRPWPQLDPATLAALVAARRLHQLNLALTLRRPGLDACVARAHALIGEWMA